MNAGAASKAVALRPSSRRYPNTGRTWIGILLGVAVSAAPARGQGPPPIVWSGPGHISVRSVATDGRLLATASSVDHTVKLWDLATGRLLRTLAGQHGPGHYGEVHAVALSDDGKWVASCGEFVFGAPVGNVKLWNAATGKLVRNFATTSHCFAVDISGDGSLLAATNGTDVLLFRVSDGALLRQLPASDSWYTLGVALSPDGQLVAAASADHNIYLWRVSDGLLLHVLAGHTSIATTVDFSPDGGTLASGSYDGTVRLWNVASGAPLRVLEGHLDGVLSVAFAPDGETLASGGNAGDLWLWRPLDPLAAGTVLAENGATVFDVAWMPDGKSLVSGGSDGHARRWRVSDGALLANLGNHTGPAFDVAFSPDDSLFASAGGEGTMILWSAADGTVRRRLSDHLDLINGVAFSPDGSMVATATGSAPPDTRETLIRVWSAATGALLQTLPGHAEGTTALLFTADGLSLVSGGRDNAIRLWSLSSGSNYRTLTGHTAWVNTLALSPDGLVLASGAGDASARLWRLSDGAPLRRLATSYSVADVAFSPAGDLLATGEEGYGTTVRLWDVTTGTPVRSFSPDPSGFIDSVAFSPVDGALAASSGQASVIHIWDPATGALLSMYDAETSWGLFPSQPLAFSRGGLLGYGRGDATVVVADRAGAPVSGLPFADGFETGLTNRWTGVTP